jgi:hypothetical protein
LFGASFDFVSLALQDSHLAVVDTFRVLIGMGQNVFQFLVG